MDQSNLLDNLKDFNDRSRPKTAEGINKKRITYKRAYTLYEGQELTLNVLTSGIFPITEKRRRTKKLLKITDNSYTSKSR